MGLLFLSILHVQEALRIMRILNEIFGLGPIYQYIVSEHARKSSIFAKKIIMICTCNNRKSDSGGGWIFLGRFGKYIFILIWAILLLSCLAFVLCCMSGTLKRGFLIPYVADIANVLLHWISDTIAQMFRFNT